MQYTLIIIVIIVAIIFSLLGHLKRQAGTATDAKEARSYQKVPMLLTPAERSFFGVLEGALAGRFRIMAKVRLADIIKVAPGTGGWRSAYNKINAKHVDFLLCRPEDLGIEAAIELDDASHDRPDRRRRDENVEAILAAAGLPLIRFAVKRGYTIQEVQSALADQINKPPETPGGSETAKCPECGGLLVLRTANRGEHAGKKFWGCSNYPQCKAMMPVGDHSSKGYAAEAQVEKPH